MEHVSRDSGILGARISLPAAAGGRQHRPHKGNVQEISNRQSRGATDLGKVCLLAKAPKTAGQEQPDFSRSGFIHIATRRFGQLWTNPLLAWPRFRSL